MPTLPSSVQMKILPSEKYKTIRINIRFAAELDAATVEKRTLLSSILETSSQKYPTQIVLAQALDEMYGANFGINVNKMGNRHILTFVMNVVNDKFLSEKGILAQAVAFLKEIIFNPLKENGHFSEATFQLEKENMMRYMDGIYEDKQTYSALKLEESYFSDPNMKVPSFGRRENVAKITNDDLYAYYEEMLAHDQVDIAVIGDVEEEKMTELFADFPFEDNPRLTTSIFYDQEVTNVVDEGQEQQNILQSKLNLAYHTPEEAFGPTFFAGKVFNGLFGGFPHSLLFMNVREKESLAYYASSSLDGFRHLLTVQTGIDGKNRMHVLHLISRQLQAMQRGDFTELAFNQTIANLRNNFLMRQDNPQSELDFSYQQSVETHPITPSKWLELLSEVTPEAVVAFAKEVRLQSVFFLEGVQNEN